MIDTQNTEVNILDKNQKNNDLKEALGIAHAIFFIEVDKNGKGFNHSVYSAINTSVSTFLRFALTTPIQPLAYSTSSSFVCPNS